jgi:hypothetical protein
MARAQLAPTLTRIAFGLRPTRARLAFASCAARHTLGAALADGVSRTLSSSARAWLRLSVAWLTLGLRSSHARLTIGACSARPRLTLALAQLLSHTLSREDDNLPHHAMHHAHAARSSAVGRGGKCDRRARTVVELTHAIDRLRVRPSHTHPHSVCDAAGSGCAPGERRGGGCGRWWWLGERRSSGGRIRRPRVGVEGSTSPPSPCTPSLMLAYARATSPGARASQLGHRR